MREPGTGGYGGLAPLGRRALQPRLERIASALAVRERLQVTAQSAAGNWRDTFAPGQAARATSSAPPRPLPYTASPAGSHFPGPPWSEAGAAERALRDVQLELRALRAEIAQLARALGFPARDSNRVEYKGVLQQRDPLDSDVRLARWRREECEEQRCIERELRRAEARRLELRRQELLRALRRAEERLAAEAESVPLLLRFAVIGEILRARYDIAFFGGLSGTALNGMQYDLAA